MGDWRKSTYSDATGGSCVELATATDGVTVRDTTNRDGAVLDIPAEAWARFARSLK